MRVEILPSARDDLVDGFAFYESQALGLGGKFLESRTTDIDSLRQHAGIRLQVSGKFRMLGSRFPYAVYYGIADETVRVIAVLDCRRDPRWITKRLRQRPR